jgi:hypothetical protein
MKINDPKASYSQVSAIFLNTVGAGADLHGHRLLVSVKPGSLIVDGGKVSFEATVLEWDVESLYVAPSERLANR